MNKERTLEDVKQFAMALAICDIKVEVPVAHIILDTYDCLLEKGDQMSIRDASKIIANVNEIYGAK